MAGAGQAGAGADGAARGAPRWGEMQSQSMGREGRREGRREGVWADRSCRHRQESIEQESGSAGRCSEVCGAPLDTKGRSATGQAAAAIGEQRERLGLALVTKHYCNHREGDGH